MFYSRLVLVSLLIFSSAGLFAEDSALSGVELGFGYDRGLGISGRLDKFQGFIGNDGMSVDYIFHRQVVGNIDNQPVSWYVGGGAYVDWNGDAGARMPVGLDLTLPQGFSAYLQVIPEFEVMHKARFDMSAAIGVRYRF